MHAACNTRADPPHDINRTRACHPAHNRPKKRRCRRRESLSKSYPLLHHESSSLSSSSVAPPRGSHDHDAHHDVLATPFTTVCREFSLAKPLSAGVSRPIRSRFDVTRYSLLVTRYSDWFPCAILIVIVIVIVVVIVIAIAPAVDDVVSAAATVKHTDDGSLDGKRREEEAKESCGKTEQ